MSRWTSSLRQWAVWAGLASGLCWRASLAATPIADPDVYLKQTQALATTDHPRFLQQLALLNQEASRLRPDQMWRLRYSNAWEAMYESDYAKSEALFQDIIQHSDIPALADRASAMLLSQLGLTRHYTEAFELANRIAARLPQVTDAKARLPLLQNLSISLGEAGQTDVAVHYARMAMAAVPAGDSLCYPASALIEALFDGHRLKSDSPELQQAFDACPVASEPVFNANLWLKLAELHIEEGQPRKALALLDRIAPELDVNGYVPYKLEALVDRAKALAAVGENVAARNAALAAIAARPAGDSGNWLKDTYEVLYHIEKKQGDTAAALDYYEKYAALDKAYLDDVNARAMAYQAVQQHVLAQKLETENLSRQNALLRMRQTLDAKTVEANRLYLALLLMVLAFALLWMFRLKRSQLRFKKLSHLDGLTAVFNRQHFMGEVDRMLRLLEKRAGNACLVFIDLDHFKRINDTHGHAMGDEVLRQVVVAGRQQLRPGDLFGRLGGEEFGILLVGCSHEQGVAIAERIRSAVEATAVECEGAVITISTSLGLACTGACGHDLRRLCREADAALYRAKRGGRNRVEAGAGNRVSVAG
ncbi:GGDEF domain-containing protein [Rhodanobacter aciditrophus]|uniref:GGDEF domain-containing protein n=1 Tax=Rhodanobacter aciditrophus TaxID=1623218 RepID=UPI003CE74082